MLPKSNIMNQRIELILQKLHNEMNLKRKIIIGILIIGIVLVGEWFVMKQLTAETTKKTVEKDMAIDDLQLTIKSEKEVYEVGEDIILSATLNLTSDEEKTVSGIIPTVCIYDKRMNPLPALYFEEAHFVTKATLPVFRISKDNPQNFTKSIEIRKGNWRNIGPRMYSEKKYKGESYKGVAFVCGAMTRYSGVRFIYPAVLTNKYYLSVKLIGAVISKKDIVIWKGTLTSNTIAIKVIKMKD